MLRIALLVVGLWLCASGLSAQTVSGTITDAGGEPLPFATVTAKGVETLGATASLEGRYSIDLGGRGGTLEFRYVGYEVAAREVAAGPARQTLDVTLTPATYELGVASVSAGAEDPAYRIMREAAARRKAYLRADERYEVEVYVKGQVKVDKAPDKILGRDLGDIGGLLDSNRAGIVYLSETYSTVQFEQPGKFKETVTASTVSGDPRGYSFNTATSLSFDLYQERADWGRPVASPLADKAASVYRFALEGARVGEGGRLVYRIRVEPRGTAVPGYGGVVYVEDESFHLVDADLYLLGATVNAPGLDSLKLLQSFRRRGGDAGWETYQRRAEPIIELLGFRFRGIFAAVYGAYDYAPVWPRSPFGAIVSEVLAEANAVDSARFAERPIPLTDAEQRDYVRKDSLRRAVESPAYRDSIEQRGNRVGLGIITGYTHTDWRKHSRYSVTSPLTDIAFHSVTGLRLATGLEYDRKSDEAGTRELHAEAKLGYGFADEELYPTAAIGYRFDPVYRQELRVRGGRELADYHRLQPVDAATNTLYSLFAKHNELKLYERRFAEVTHVTQLHGDRAAPWARLSHTLAFEWRGFRQNETNYSLRRRARTYEPNAPLYVSGAGEPQFIVQAPSTFLRYSGTLTFAPGQTYLLRPDVLLPTGAAWAELSVDWRYGIAVSNPKGFDRPQFLFLGLSAKRSSVTLGRFGKLGVRVSLGRSVFLVSDQNIIDAQHFGGSELPVALYGDYLDRYLAADYFTFSTNEAWVDGVVEHDFDGWLWQRLPLLKKLGWSIVTRAGAIYLPVEGRLHSELGVGLNKVGFGPARPIRVDVVWAYNQVGRVNASPTWRRPVLRVGVKLPEGLLGR